MTIIDARTAAAFAAAAARAMHAEILENLVRQLAAEKGKG